MWCAGAPTSSIALLDDIAGNGYGLTLGIHSRIDATVEQIVARLAHGNVYVNRNMIGAVVGTQPFGGSGPSGTGPKAGGPNYLRRFATEQTVTINTAAAGGNASADMTSGRIERGILVGAGNEYGKSNSEYLLFYITETSFAERSRQAEQFPISNVLTPRDV